MSYTLTNRLKVLGGLTFSEASILYRFCDASKDDRTAFLSISDLAMQAKCTERAAYNIVTRLEARHILRPNGSAGGRGHIQLYDISLDGLPIQERKPARKNKVIRLEPIPPDDMEGAQPPAPLPAETERHRANWREEMARRTDPRERQPGETATQWARRVDSLVRR